MKGCPVPVRWPRLLSASAASASVWESSSWFSAATVSAEVVRSSQALSGSGTPMVVVWPSRKRTWSCTASVRSIVTSSMSRRTMRLRSRCGVAGSAHRAGKSLARERIFAFCSSLKVSCAASLARS